jgi:predicted ATPase
MKREQGCDDEAETSLQEALQVARAQNAKSWELRAALDLADLWKQQGKGEKGKKLVKEIYSWFTEGFDTPDLQAARNFCEEMESG